MKNVSFRLRNSPVLITSLLLVCLIPITTTGSVIDYADGVTNASSITLNSNTTQLQVTTGTATQSGVISEAGGSRPLEKIGVGTLILTNVNTYTGTTTISAGTLELNSGASVGGNILNNATLSVVNNGSDPTIANTISGTGSLSINGGGTGIITLTGANSYGGGTTVTNGYLIITGDGNLGAASGSLALTNTFIETGFASYTMNRATTLTGTNVFVNSGATVLTLAGDITGTGSLNRQNGGTMVLTGTNTYLGGTGIFNGTLQLGNGGSTGSITGNVTLNSSTSRLVFNRNNSLALGGNITGNGSVLQIGSGTTTLSGASTYIGKTIIEGGSLVVTGSLGNSIETYVGNTNGGTNLTLSGGGDVSNTTASIGVTAASDGNTALVTGSGSTWTITGDLNVGFEGADNILTVQSQGQVLSNATKIGGYAGATGNEVVVDGTGSLFSNTTYVAVGYGGNGNKLTVQNGGKAQNEDAFIGFRLDPTTISSNNVVEVKNTGSLWENTGTFSLGYYGSGNALTISDGGRVTVNTTAKDALIGFDAASNNNTLTVTGAGSEFENDATFYVGNNGQNNSLDVLAGGVVTSRNVRIGGGATSSGNNATVDGSGSAWNIAGTLRVGSNGATNSLDITNGGQVTVTGNSFLGYAATSTGNSVTVNGTGSLLDAAALVVGRDGSGTINVEAGGEVEATSLTLGLNAGSSGTLNIGTGGAAGLIDTASIASGAGTAIVNFNHTASDYFFTNTSLSGGTAVVISGTTAVNQIAGVTTLLGTNTYTGATSVTGGSLLVNGSLGSTDVTVLSGATLGGSGSMAGNVVVQSGGILAPGNSPGILTLGDLTLDAGSTTRMEINGTTAGTQYDQLQITTDAALDGTLDLIFGYVPTAGDVFTLISAGGNITGTFADIATNLGAALLVEETYNASTFVIEVALAQSDYVPFARTPNQAGVAANLDGFSTSGQMQDLIDYLNTLTAGQLPAAFDQLAPEEWASLSQVAFANSRNVFTMLGNRRNELQNGQQYSSNGLTLWDNGREFKESLMAAGSEAVPGMKLYEPTQNDRRLGFFVSGQGTFGDVDGDGNGDNYDFSTGGMILGSDYRLLPDTTIGIYAGYQGSETNTGRDSEIKSDAAKFGVYGNWFHEKGSWLSANIGGAAQSYDSERVSVGGIATGDTTGTEINTQLVLGHDFKAGNVTFGPEAELGYTHVWIDGFTESGSLAPLIVQDQEGDSLRSTLAMKVNYDWKISTFTLRPYARLGWQHEFMDDNQAVSARFASGAGNIFTVRGSETARDSVVAGAGASLLFSETISAMLGYSAEANEDYEVHSINGSFNFQF